MRSVLVVFLLVHWKFPFMIITLLDPTMPAGCVAVLCRKIPFASIIISNVSIAGSVRYASGTALSPAASEPVVGGMESKTKTVDTGLATSQTGSDVVEPVWDLLDSGTVPMNQIIPTIKTEVPQIFVNLRKNRLPPKNVIRETSQLIAIGMTALWQG